MDHTVFSKLICLNISQPLFITKLALNRRQTPLWEENKYMLLCSEYLTVCACRNISHCFTGSAHLGAAQHWTCLRADGEMGERSGKPAFGS